MSVRAFREEGSTLVETAVVFVVLMGFITGILELCQGLYAYHFTAEAARLATRYAMVRGSSCSGLSGCNATGSDIQTYVRGITFPGISPSKVTALTNWPTTGSACTPSASPCNNPGNLVQVKVQYAQTIVLPFFKDINLGVSSTSQMVISQ